MIRVDVVDSDGVIESVKTYAKIVYSVPLNGVRDFDVFLAGVTSDYRTRFAKGNVINFYDDGTLELKGVIMKTALTSDGFLRLQGIGWGEKKLRDANCPDADWTASDTSGVIADDGTNLLAKQPAIGKGNVANQTVNFYRTYINQNLLEGITKLCELTGQDWSLDDANSKLDVSDHLGGTGTQFILTDGKEIVNLSVEEDDTEIVEKIVVLGAGYGTNPVSGVWGNGGAGAPDWDPGDPEKSVIDKSLGSNQQCQDRAQQLYTVEQATRNVYKFEVINSNLSFSLGDEFTIYSELLGIDTLIRLVSFKRVVLTNEEHLYFEVRGTSERETAEDLLKRSKLNEEAEKNLAAMNQSQGNYLAWGDVINAKNGAPCRVVFEVTDDMYDLSGSLNVISLKVDYDLDPFRLGAGISSEDNIAPSVSGASTVQHKHNPSDGGHVHSVSAPTSDAQTRSSISESVTSSSNSATVNTSWVDLLGSAKALPSSFEFGFIMVAITNASSSATTATIRIRAKNVNDSSYSPSSAGLPIETGWPGNSTIFCTFPIDSTWSNNSFQIRAIGGATPSGSIAAVYPTYFVFPSHSHTISALTGVQTGIADVDDNNRDPSLSGNAASHKHNVVIGDDIDDAAGVNSAQVSLYLDFWNTGTSNWDNKHSVLNTGKTLDTNVDISNGGVYPDVIGFWRVRVDPSSASPDLVSAVVKLKSSLDV